MPKVEINTSEEPIRLFKSNFLEFFTHITPLAIIIIWTPVAIIFLASAIINRPQDGLVLIVNHCGFRKGTVRISV